VFRGDYYLGAKKPEEDSPDFPAWMEEMERIHGRADLIVAKQRHGATGTVRMRFDSRITKFSDPIDEGYMPELRG
jgi:replicative DNA helicase